MPAKKRQKKQLKSREKEMEKQKIQIKEQKLIIENLKKKVKKIEKYTKNNNKEKITVLKKEINLIKKQAKKQTITLISSAFGFVAALFWRDAIKAFFEQIFNITLGSGNSWFAQTLIALGITIFAVVVIYYISKF